ncbi:hypothetical protein GC173_17430 [bacterium]|nr:hypothetical protein [bacterium]
MAGPNISGRSYGLLILAVVVAMVASNLIAQSGVMSQGSDVSAATRDVASATRDVAASNREIAASNARIADAILKLADAVKEASKNDDGGSAGAAATDRPAAENIPATNQGIEFSN